MEPALSANSFQHYPTYTTLEIKKNFFSTKRISNVKSKTCMSNMLRLSKEKKIKTMACFLECDFSNIIRTD